MHNSSKMIRKSNSFYSSSSCEWFGQELNYKSIWYPGWPTPLKNNSSSVWTEVRTPKHPSIRPGLSTQDIREELPNSQLVISIILTSIYHAVHNLSDQKLYTVEPPFTVPLRERKVAGKENYNLQYFTHEPAILGNNSPW